MPNQIDFLNKQIAKKRQTIADKEGQIAQAQKQNEEMAIALDLAQQKLPYQVSGVGALDFLKERLAQAETPEAEAEIIQQARHSIAESQATIAILQSQVQEAYDRIAEALPKVAEAVAKYNDVVDALGEEMLALQHVAASTRHDLLDGVDSKSSYHFPIHNVQLMERLPYARMMNDGTIVMELRETIALRNEQPLGGLGGVQNWYTKI